MNDQLTTTEFPLADGDDALARLAACANEAHDKVAGALQQAVLHALAAGQALLEAKRLCPKGAWTGWLNTNFRGSGRAARGYMRLVVYWHQVGGDWQRAASLSQRQIEKLLKGLSCSDGRANPGRPAIAQRLEPEESLNETGASFPAESITNEAASASSPASPPPPSPPGGDPFDAIVELLERAVAELRGLCGEPEHARYARHLLRPLKRLRAGIGKRRWFWNMVKG